MCPSSSVGVTHFFATMRTSGTSDAPSGFLSWFASCATPPCPCRSPSDGLPSVSTLMTCHADPGRSLDALRYSFRYCFPAQKTASTYCFIFCYRGSIPSRFRIAAHHLPHASLILLPSSTQHSVLKSRIIKAFSGGQDGLDWW